MSRFTIRDVLWLTVVVALAVGWWADRSALSARQRATFAHAERLRDTLSEAKQSYTHLFSFLKDVQVNFSYLYFEPNWSVADEPIPK